MRGNRNWIGIGTVIFVTALVVGWASGTPSRAIVCECANDDSPVRCSGGKIYPNACVAHCFHAHGCKPI
ncbi:MAG TPA: hypothetical protein VJS92_17795 [Candidatus Polarisedimenticolaceae bacterium]|nr:hypothetical protein [Candidatus Polarisedimenticolaceae bacterium]